MSQSEIAEGIFSILTFIEIILLFLINIYGAAYDGLKKEHDKNYSKNHSFSVRTNNSLKIRFSIPFIIRDKSNTDSLKKVIRKYNKLSISFWIILFAMLILYIVS